MKLLDMLSVLLAAAASWNLGSATVPHGCGCGHHVPQPPTYEGPSDTTGSPAVPRDRAASGGAAPAPARATGNSPGGQPVPGGPLGASATERSWEQAISGWEMWWGFNRTVYLDLKRQVLASGPYTGSDGFFLGRGALQQRTNHAVTDARLRDEVAPALRSAIESDPDVEVRGAAMVALAKLGGILSQSDRNAQRELFERNLVHPNQTVVECAIVALGLLGTTECAITLCEIAHDSPIGGSLLNRVSVPGRTRALAALSLGLVGSRCENPEVRRHIVFTLAQILEVERAGAADLAVACVISLGLTPLPDVNSPLQEQGRDVLPPETSRATQIRFLCEKLIDPNVRVIVRAHVPRALGRLLHGDEDPQKEIVAETMLGLLNRHRKVEHTVRVGIVFGLGMIGDADADSVDVKIRKALKDAARDAHVFQQRVTLVALALVSGRPGSGEGHPFAGAEEVRSFLLRQLARGKSRGRPWAALALGLQGFHEIDSGREPMPAVGSALRDRLARTRAPSDAGALCIALGLSQDQASVPLLLEEVENANGEEARAHAALALGLLGARGAIPDLRATLEHALHQPILLREASIALALLGDKHVVEMLMEKTTEEDSEFTRTAAIHALGYVGDDRVIDLLIDLVAQDEHSSEIRKFAAVALGMVAEQDLEPWTSLYTIALNYAAMTETLGAGESAGILNLR